MKSFKSELLFEQLDLTYLSELASFSALSDAVIIEMIRGGRVDQLAKGESIGRFNEEAVDFQILLKGRLAYYKNCDDHYVLTRYFEQGEQLGFDEMIGLFKRNGTDVAVEDSLILNISSQQFYQVHKKFPGEFGIFMLNLALALSREITILEDVIARGTGWSSTA